VVDTEERDLPPKDALAATIPEAAAHFWTNHWPATMQTKKTKRAESAPTLIVVAVLALCTYMTNLAICLVLCPLWTMNSEQWVVFGERGKMMAGG